jgi:hypothetical protein
LCDRLAKSFDQFLHAAIGSDKKVRGRFLSRGWKDFINSDRPETNSAAEMAAAAVLYLGVHNSSWLNEPILIKSAIAFLRHHLGHDPQIDLADLAKILKTNPVKSQDVYAWFIMAFP